MRLRTLALFGLVLLAAAFVLWQRALEPAILPPAQAAAGSATVAPPAAASDLTSLAAALEAERAARSALADQVAALRAEVARLSGGVASAPTTAPPSGLLGVGPPSAFPPAAPDFDEQALRDAGFGERETHELRARMENLALERLYLRDRAVREGWASSPRFAGEMGTLDAKTRGLRDELGDERYDWLLYASGQSNRVVVQSVMDSSPASTAGIQPGDSILTYDGSRLFDASTLRDATTQGRAGESVPVEVSRGGETLRLFVPRGPLGVRLQEGHLRPGSAQRS